MWSLIRFLIGCGLLVVLLPGPLVADEPEEETNEEERAGEFPARTCLDGSECDHQGRALRLGKSMVFCTKCGRLR